MLARHQELAAYQKSLIEAVMAGDKKQAVQAMRAIRKTLQDELGLAKAIARATYAPTSIFVFPTHGSTNALGTIPS